MVQAAPAVVAAETLAVVPRMTGSTTLVIRTLSWMPVVTGVCVDTGFGVADAVVPVGAVDAPTESGIP